MSRHEVIEWDAANAQDGGDAGEHSGDADRAKLRVSTRGSCVVLEIACDANGASIVVPVRLSPAASRALAVDLAGAADALER